MFKYFNFFKKPVIKKLPIEEFILSTRKLFLYYGCIKIECIPKKKISYNHEYSETTNFIYIISAVKNLNEKCELIARTSIDYKGISLVSHNRSCKLNELKNLLYFKFKKKEDNYYIIGYTRESYAVNIIMKYWRKYRWNYLRNLAAIKYHPSRLTFEID